MDIDPKKYPRIEKGLQWLEKEDGSNFLSQEEHAPTRDIFQARLDRMGHEMQKMGISENIYSLVFSIGGELGNNSFDHNIGRWRDELGIYFVYDFEKKFFVVADRGQGILATLKDVKPDLKDDREALRVAFTEAISGRSPEHRGNGLKFVERIVKEKDWNLSLYSVKGVYSIIHGVSSSNLGKKEYKGTIAVLFF